MFGGASSFTSNLSSWNISSVTGSIGGMFNGAVNLQCIGRLNTLNQTYTLNLFSDTPSLVYPNDTDQSLILAGYAWNNDVYCPFFVTRWLQDLLYDKSNIKDEFTSLTGMDSARNVLEAVSYDGVAESEPLTVTDLTKRITGIKDGSHIEFEGNFLFTSI